MTLSASRWGLKTRFFIEWQIYSPNLRVSVCSVLVVERSRKGSGKADWELHFTAPDFVDVSMLFVVKLDIVVVVVVLLMGGSV